MKILAVIDMQKDFVDGALGTPEAVTIVGNVAERVKKAVSDGEYVLFTRDTHYENYLETLEGRNLPVKHCIKGTEGWEIIPELAGYVGEATVIDKPSFGSIEFGSLLRELDGDDPVEMITMIGLCTDICVISNALMAKASLPEVPVRVEAACCAGVTPATHTQALEAMKMCQIEIV